ncbi:cytochrome c1 [Reyranella sp. CPCC 100927]|uniref:cytochrome c1 n=1 Tax=Reyranella sp. CPCC 100927 TaxID=2599616 RepID=UPI0011B7A081|nr:cytochrome c1 [Reyranella sp. CPCC 100927]TWT15676.1 cytochrome c1 [Reyranella sp. CPCC 100927]
MRKLFATGALILPLLTASAAPAMAEGGHGPALLPATFSFEGPFGTYDRGAAQRGFQIYKEVCSACHSLSLVSYRNLMDLGLSEAAVKGIAADVQVNDVNDKGETIERPGKPSDRFKKPFPNEAAAAAANGGAAPPDLSLIIKARPNGARYVFSLLQGYVEDVDKLPAPEKAALGLAKDYKLEDGKSFNKYFHPGEQGYKIGMAKPLNDGQITYVDGAKNDLASMSRDVVTFLAWAAEPKMEERKRTGVRVILFLLIFAGMMYAVKRKVWANAH